MIRFAPPLCGRLWGWVIGIVLAVLLCGQGDLGLLDAAPAAAAEPLPKGSTVNLGIVFDSESETLVAVMDEFEKEVTDLLAGSYEVNVARKISLAGDFSRTAAEQALGQLFADPEVDIVICVGYVGSITASHMGKLPKPVIAPYALDAQWQGLSTDAGGGSGIKNLNYFSFPAVATLHLNQLKQLVDFDVLALMGPPVMFETNPQFTEVVAALGSQQNVEIIPVPLTTDIAGSVANIPPDVGAVTVLTPTLTHAQVKELAEGLIARKLPAFSFVGAVDVELGFLAGMVYTQKVSRFARRVALNVQRILAGIPPEELPVAFPLNTRLGINLATARALSIAIPWDLRLEADIIQAEPAPTANRLDLLEVLQETLAANLDLRAQQEAVAAGEEAVKQARSPLLPQAEIGARGLIIDEDRAAASFGSNPERTAVASATVTQLLFSDKAHANHAIQKHLQAAREDEYRQLEQDVLLDAATAYLDVLRAGTLEGIERDNLILTRSNLELAQVRERVGVAGPAEVYRWEAEIAAQRNDLIQANSRRNLAEIQLNRLLNRPLEESFVLADLTLESDLLAVDENWLRRYLGDPVSFRKLRSWTVAEAVANAPELKALDDAIAAQQRALSAAGRAFYVPTVALQGAYDRIVDKGGAGVNGFSFDPSSLPPEQQGLAEALGSAFPESPDDDNWSVGLSLSLPLFEGGGLRAEKQKARRDLELLVRQRDAAALGIAQRARSAAHTAGASFANIRHSRDAADAAAKSLEVVTDAYARGAADLLDLLDAQNAALVTDRVAANAVYDFLVDFMAIQRSISALHLFLDREASDRMVERLDAYMAEEED